MGKRRLKLHFSIYGEYVDSAVIELDDAVIEAVDDAWRSTFFYNNLRTPERIAAHVGYNLIINDLSLSQMDGWADQPDENARVLEWPLLPPTGWEIEAEEVTSEE